MRTSEGSRTAPLLVGRAAERDVLDEHLRRGLAGAGVRALLGGEAGIDKTRLARTVLAEAEQGGARTLDGACFPLGMTADYEPFVGALRTTLRESPVLAAELWLAPLDHRRASLPAAAGTRSGLAG